MNKNLRMLTKLYEGEEVVFRNNIATGISEVCIDNVAKFCGWTRIAKSGNESVRWERVNGFLQELGVPTCGHGDFIPEIIMYRLIGKAKNDRANKFMNWVGQVLVEIRTNGGYILDNATEEQVDKLISKWGSKYCTKEIHDSKSVRKYIRECDPMKIDECIDKIVDVTEPMKGAIKHNILDSAIKELKKIDSDLMKDTIKHTYIKDTACAGIITLQDVKIGKFRKRIKTLESKAI